MLISFLNLFFVRNAFAYAGAIASSVYLLTTVLMLLIHYRFKKVFCQFSPCLLVMVFIYQNIILPRLSVESNEIEDFNDYLAGRKAIFAMVFALISILFAPTFRQFLITYLVPALIMTLSSLLMYLVCE